MRHGIVATSVLALTLTLASWIVGEVDADRPSLRPAAALGVPPAVGTRPVDPAPSLPAAPALAAPSLEVDSASSVAAEFHSAINARRSVEDLSSVERRAELDDLARSWAATMGRDGSLRHSDLIHDMVAGSWTTAGENVGYGPSAAMVFSALEASPAHLANMLNPDYTAVGIGVVQVGDVVWTAHLFAG